MDIAENKEDFGKFKELVMTTVNGKTSPTTLSIQKIQDEAKEALAKAKTSVQTAIQTAPQQAKEIAELAKLKVKKTAAEAEISVIDNAINILDNNIQAQEDFLNKAKATKKQLDKQYQILKAKKKSATDSGTDGTDQQTDVPDIVKELNFLKKQRKNLEDKRKSLQEDLAIIDNDITSGNYRISIINAQINPEAAKLAAHKAVEDTQKTVDAAPNNEARTEAETKLQKVQEMESTIDTIADEQSAAVEQIKEQQEPKMMQLRAEFQFMEMGVRAFNYLLTNMNALNVSLNAVPSTIVAGSATGAANPVYAKLFGNPNFGVLYFILGSLKASSIRFLALAQEIEYTPTVETTTIAAIKVCEESLNSFLANAPAGAALNL